MKDPRRYAALKLLPLMLLAMVGVVLGAIYTGVEIGWIFARAKIEKLADDAVQRQDERRKP